MSSNELQTIADVVRIARQSLEPSVFDWADSGAGEGVTVSRNREALNRLALVPRVLRPAEAIDLASSFVGIPMAIPVMLAPVGALGLYDSQDAVSSGRAAAQVSTSTVCSMLTTSLWEDVAATAPGRHLFQVYVFGDRKWMSDVVGHAEAAGFGAICVTLDTPVIGRRDRSLRRPYVWRPSGDAKSSLEQHGATDPTYRRRYSANDLEWFAATAGVPVVAKGVMTAEDARVAVECGVAGIYVSNHGGRQVDHGISTIEMLEEIAEAVPDTVDVAVDGGFLRGPEVCKALALGAKVAAIGRLQCWGLAAGGETGLVRVLEILRDEIEATLANIGCRSVPEVRREHVRWSFPAAPTN